MLSAGHVEVMLEMIDFSFAMFCLVVWHQPAVHIGGPNAVMSSMLNTSLDMAC
jgi:hypothetical protein